MRRRWMALVHSNWHLVTFGIALAEGLLANRPAAKTAVVALAEQVIPKALFVDGGLRAQGGGHAPGEGPWSLVKREG